MFDQSFPWKNLVSGDKNTLRFLTRVGLMLGGLLFVGAGLYFLYSAPAIAQTIQTCPLIDSASGETVSGATAVERTMLTVDINGAVAKPGVYQLPAGSRRQDLLHLAGGYGKNISKAYVAKSLNLAQELKDQEKIYLPFANEELVTESGVGTANGSQISINQATKKELEKLAGVGEVTAEKIIAGRPFATLSDLVSRQIMSEKVFSELNTQISL